MKPHFTLVTVTVTIHYTTPLDIASKHYDSTQEIMFNTNKSKFPLTDLKLIKSMFNIIQSTAIKGDWFRVRKFLADMYFNAKVF